jgi:hypothetical protein
MMKAKTLAALFFVTISFAFIALPSPSNVPGKTWYFHSITDDFIEFRLSKPDSKGNGTFSWIVGINITDKREGKYSIKNNILTLDFFGMGVKIITKTYRIEHETKNGFLLIEQQSGMNDKVTSFLFTSSQ